MCSMAEAVGIMSVAEHIPITWKVAPVLIICWVEAGGII